MLSGSRICAFESLSGAASLIENPLRYSRLISFPARSQHNFYNGRSFATVQVENKQEETIKQSESSENQQEERLEDFQHEEIVGPTVERDESATANELRESIDSMLSYNRKLKRALIAVGCMQLAAGWYIIGSRYSAENLYLGLSAGISLQLAYVLHQTLKPLPFFQRVEERSRMRVLTLSMQSIKAVTNMLSRSNVVARYTFVALAGALAYEVVPHFVK